MTEREQSVLILHDRAPISEIAAMAVLCALTVETGCCAHVCHVPTPQAADLIGEARQRGARMTAETCPHHLTFTQADMERCGAFAKCNHPCAARAAWTCSVGASPPAAASTSPAAITARIRRRPSDGHAGARANGLSGRLHRTGRRMRVLRAREILYLEELIP